MMVVVSRLLGPTSASSEAMDTGIVVIVLIKGKEADGVLIVTMRIRIVAGLIVCIVVDREIARARIKVRIILVAVIVITAI